MKELFDILTRLEILVNHQFLYEREEIERDQLFARAKEIVAQHMDESKPVVTITAPGLLKYSVRCDG